MRDGSMGCSERTVEAEARDEWWLMMGTAVAGMDDSGAGEREAQSEEGRWSLGRTSGDSDGGGQVQAADGKRLGRSISETRRSAPTPPQHFLIAWQCLQSIISRERSSQSSERFGAAPLHWY